MNCLKCGRETEQTFCEQCRADMEKNPVKPGTIVLLPKERPNARKPQPRHPQVPLEEVVAAQRRTVRRLGRAVAVLAVLVVLLAGVIIRLLVTPTSPPVGQNYSTSTRPSEETGTSAAETSETEVSTEKED